MIRGTFIWERQIRSSTAKVSGAGYCVIGLLVGCFGYWAATAPLAGAAVAQGAIAAAGRNIRIQHLEGGIVREILAVEGDLVRAGQTLIVLDDTAPRTQVNRLTKQFISLSATSERLAAERDGNEELVFSSRINAYVGDTDLDHLIDEQQKEFGARLVRFLSELNILNQRVSTLEETMVGLRAQKTAVENQLEIVADELRRKKTLIDQGLTNRFEYTQIQRNQADLVGQVGSIESSLASTQSQVAEAREQIERLRSQRVEQAVSQLAETRVSLADVEEQLQAAESVLSRTVIRSPTDGIIVSGIYNSAGAVIAAGEKVLEILPTTSRLIVEVRVSPTDIDDVHVSQPARLRLSALNARLTPEVAGFVTEISADRLVDQNTGEAYFRAKIEISEQLPAQISAEQLYPGMPVEAFISTGERTFLEYLIRPIADSFQRAFAAD